jgi:putative sigma-54 modulation protein
MKVSVTFRHMKPSDPLREYVEEKVRKAGKLLNGSSEAHVVLSVEKHLSMAHIELITGGAFRVRADERAEDMYATIDLATDKLVQQLKRFREKVRDSHRANRGRELPHRVLRITEAPPPGTEVPGQELKPQLIRQETIVAHEMSVEEALEKMDLLNSDFLVFTDDESHHVSVMYRLPDGSFGLIEARPDGAMSESE